MFTGVGISELELQQSEGSEAILEPCSGCWPKSNCNYYLITAYFKCKCPIIFSEYLKSPRQTLPSTVFSTQRSD